MTKKIIQVSKNPVYDFGMIATVLSKDTELSGDISFKKSLQINGKFEGEITSGGILVVGEGAEIKANIRANTVILKGTINGNVEAADRLEIHEAGRLYGNIRTAQLKIADGVVFEGKCEMIRGDERAGKGKKTPAGKAPAQPQT